MKIALVGVIAALVLQVVALPLKADVPTTYYIFPALQTRVFKKIGKTVAKSYNNFMTNGPSPMGQMDRHRKEQIMKSVGLKPHRTGSGLLSKYQAGNGAKSTNSKTKKKGAVVSSVQETRPGERALILDAV